jgi:hypothetical protein
MPFEQTLSPGVFMSRVVPGNFTLMFKLLHRTIFCGRKFILMGTSESTKTVFIHVTSLNRVDGINAHKIGSVLK